MLPADVPLEPGDRTPRLHRRDLLVNVGSGAGRHVGLHAEDIARHVTEHLRDADPGTRRVALLAAERETLPVRRLEQRSQLPGLFGELGVVRIEVRQALRVGSLMAVTVVARCNFQSLWLAGSVCSCPGNGRFRDGREGGW